MTDAAPGSGTADASGVEAPVVDAGSRGGDAGLPGRRRLAPYVAAAVLAVAAAFVFVLATGDATTQRGANIGVLGRSVPPVSGETLDGSTFAIQRPPGEVLVVNFFATWCVPCIREHPELVNFERRHSLAGDASLVSVLFNDRVSEAVEFFEDNGGDWPVVLDPDGGIAVSFGVSAMPETYVIAPDGTVVEKLIGGVTAAQLDQIVARYTGAA